MTQYNSTEIPTWNHLDFTWGIDANKILYKQIIQTMLNSEPSLDFDFQYEYRP